ncbi:MAG TPA: hypothetical protein VGY66_24660 [Gemmataceae bacterium]|jgi:hypothetical protein|nr:hypothetical protein [Gemmataceae bacterium]
MPRPIRSIEIYLPLEYNDGTHIQESKFVGLQEELLTRYGGVTSTQRQFPLQGLWQRGTRVFQDRIVVFAVMDFREETDLESLRYLDRLKGRLKKKFDQLEILITVQHLLAV